MTYSSTSRGVSAWQGPPSSPRARGWGWWRAGESHAAPERCYSPPRAGAAVVPLPGTRLGGLGNTNCAVRCRTLTRVSAKTTRNTVSAAGRDQLLPPRFAFIKKKGLRNCSLSPAPQEGDEGPSSKFGAGKAKLAQGLGGTLGSQLGSAARRRRSAANVRGCINRKGMRVVINRSGRAKRNKLLKKKKKSLLKKICKRCWQRLPRGGPREPLHGPRQLWPRGWRSSSSSWRGGGFPPQHQASPERLQ